MTGKKNNAIRAGDIQPYQITNDDGGKWRFNKFMEYRARYKEETLPILRQYCKDNKLNLEERFLLGYLYASSYCVPTTIYLYENIDWSDLDTFWETNKPKLIFQSDKRYVKNMNWFVPLMRFYLSELKGNVRTLFVEPCKDLNPQQRWDLLYNKIMKWRYFGRFTTFLMLEALQKLGVVKSDSYFFDWKRGDTATSGAMLIEYMDESAIKFDASGVLDRDDDTLLNSLLAIIKNTSRQLKIDHLTVSIETDLCAFRKLFKQTRYYGYYYDRQLEELRKYEKTMPEHQATWDLVFKYRKDLLDNTILGELHGWNGIRPELYSKFANTGEL